MSPSDDYFRQWQLLVNCFLTSLYQMIDNVLDQLYWLNNQWIYGMIHRTKYSIDACYFQFWFVLDCLVCSLTAATSCLLMILSSWNLLFRSTPSSHCGFSSESSYDDDPAWTTRSQHQYPFLFSTYFIYYLNHQIK